MKNLFLLITIIAFTGCQTFSVKKDQRRESDKNQAKTNLPQPAPSTPAQTSTLDDDHEASPAPLPPPITQATTKWALILGPGAALSFLQIGALKNFYKLKAQPDFISGVEWGSPWGALYALDGTPQSIEWQLNKLKDSDFPNAGNWFKESGSVSMKNFSGWLKEAFQSRKVESSKISFVCPSFNMQKKTTYVMNRGEFKEVLEFCWPYPPTLKTARAAVSAPYGLAATVYYLRQQGVQRIILLNVLDGADIKSTENELLWAQLQEQYSTAATRFSGVDEVINLKAGKYNLNDFNRRKEMIDSAEKTSLGDIEKIVNKYRL